jgi:hypothetical protein
MALAGWTKGACEIAWFNAEPFTQGKDNVQGPPFSVDSTEINLLFEENFSITELKREHKV